MNKKQRLKLEKTAYHEAGHAVAAYFLDRKFKKVSIVEYENCAGHVLYPHWHPRFRPDISGGPRTNDLIDKPVLVSFAGPIAEAKSLGKRRFNHIGASQDYRNAVDMASFRCSSPKSTEKYLAWQLAAAEDFISHIVKLPMKRCGRSSLMR
jgi:ATP-dependent Zn protease